MTSWRDTASQQGQDDIDALLNAALPFAQQLLGQHGEMLPYGAALSSDGDLVMLASDPGLGEQPPSQHVLQLLYDGARGAAPERRAVAFVADVRTGDGDAVRVELEHREGLAIVVLMPYTRSRLKKTVTFGQMRANNGRPQIWPGR